MSYFKGKDLKIIEALKIEQNAVPAYEILKDCLVWTDERVKGMSSEGYEKLMDLWIVRGFIHKGISEEKWGIGNDTYLLNAWNEAKSQIPHWIGFTRLKLSDEDRKYFEDERNKILEERGDY